MTENSRRAIIVSHSPNLGGAERSSIDLTVFLSGMGFSMLTILPGPGDYSEELDLIGADYLFLPSITYWKPDARGSWYPKLPTAKQDLAIINLVREFSPNFVLTSTGTIVMGLLIATYLNVPHVWYVREFLNLDHNLQVPFYSPQLFGRFAQLSSIVVTVSKGVKDHFCVQRAVVLNPCPRPIQIEPKYMGSRIHSPRKHCFGVFATYGANKDQMVVVEAARLLRSRHVPICIHMSGPGLESSYGQGLRSRIDDLGLSDTVDCGSYQHDSNNLLGGVDIVICPSRVEAFGRVPLEAAQLGKPVIYARASGLQEQLSDETWAVGFDPGDPMSLAEAMLTTIENQLNSSELSNLPKLWYAQKYLTYCRDVSNLLSLTLGTRKPRTNRLRRSAAQVRLFKLIALHRFIVILQKWTQQPFSKHSD